MFVYSPSLVGNSFRHRCTMPPPSRREALRPPPRGGCRHRRLGEFLPDSQKENSSSKRAGPRGSGSLRFAVIRKKLLLDAALLAVFTHALETDGTVHQSKQGVIAALANVLTRHDVGATLTNQDVAGQNELTVCTLGAQTLCCGIAAVLGAAYALFMCHCNLPP